MIIVAHNPPSLFFTFMTWLPLSILQNPSYPSPSSIPPISSNHPAPTMFDPAIKLFGKTIQLHPHLSESHPSPSDSPDKNDATGEVAVDSRAEEGSSTLNDQAFPQTPSQGKEEHSFSSDHEQQSDASKSCEKMFKKPDGVLPCPRCNSMDTKFCYFNNYNLNQPRHFCKNCQRYWTAGGSIRNVPVGSGRRKNNKHRHEPPLCESIASALTIADDSSHPVFNPSIPAPPPFFLGFPYPIYAASPYWNCSTAWMPPAASSSPNSQLGKHSREETKVLVPKTLRIDDPGEAAKSSIWTTLGMKKEKGSCQDSGVFFRGVQSKSNEMGLEVENSSVLQANPAALSRSLTYHESAA